MRTVRLTYTSSVDRELHALTLHWRSILRPPVRWLARGMGALILGLCVFSMIAAGPTTTTVVLAVFVLCGFASPWEARWRRRRRYRSSPLADARIQVTFSDAHVESKLGDLATSTVGWPLFTKLLRAPDGFLLYTTPLTFVWVPHAAFSRADDRALVNDLLATHFKGKVGSVS